VKKEQTHIHRRHLEALSLDGSEAALTQIYYAFADRVMRYVYMYVGDREVAEELTSDVFFTLWERRKTLPEIDRPDAWIYKIAKYKALNYLRGQRADFVGLDQVPLQLFASTETSPEDDFISKESVEEVNRAIEQLPARTKLAFKLVREDGMKYRDAAEHLGISVKTLEARLTSAMKTIARTLSLPHGDPPPQ
jgi:RNA polymerase sigma-70 factor (ECF subfamily)